MDENQIFEKCKELYNEMEKVLWFLTKKDNSKIDITRMIACYCSVLKDGCNEHENIFTFMLVLKHYYNMDYISNEKTESLIIQIHQINKAIKSADDNDNSGEPIIAKEELEEIKLQNNEILDFCKKYELIYNDDDNELNEKINKIFTNYFKRHIKQTYLQSQYQCGLYNYLVKNNILFKNMHGRIEGLSKLIYLNKESQSKLDKIDIMVDFVQKEVDCVSKNCAKIITFTIIYNVALAYYSDCFNELYGERFLDIKDLTLQDSVLKYINLNIIDDNEELRGMFVYYLITKDKFETDDVLKGHYNCIQSFNNIYDKLKSEQDYNNFMKNISSDNKIDDSVCSITDVDLMTGIEFEFFVSELFKKDGYKTIITQASYDQGIDVVAEKNGKKYGIQAKCYSGAVSNSAVQEVVAGINYYGCSKGIVVTNNYFTKSALELSKSNGIILWDRDMLKQKILELV